MSTPHTHSVRAQAYPRQLMGVPPGPPSPFILNVGALNTIIRKSLRIIKYID